MWSLYRPIRTLEILKYCEILWDFPKKYFHLHLNSNAVYNSSAKNKIVEYKTLVVPLIPCFYLQMGLRLKRTFWWQIRFKTWIVPIMVFYRFNFSVAVISVIGQLWTSACSYSFVLLCSSRSLVLFSEGNTVHSLNKASTRDVQRC